MTKNPTPGKGTYDRGSGGGVQSTDKTGAFIKKRAACAKITTKRHRDVYQVEGGWCFLGGRKRKFHAGVLRFPKENVASGMGGREDSKTERRLRKQENRKGGGRDGAATLKGAAEKQQNRTLM